MIVSIDLEFLTDSESRQAHYLAALARKRAIERALLPQPGEVVTGTWTYETSEWEHACDEVDKFAPTPQERMRPLREVADATGIAQSTLRKRCAGHEVVSEQRYGKLWYIDAEDALRVAVEQDTARRPGRKAKHV